MGYIAPGVRTKVIRNARAIGGDTPYQIPVIIGPGNDIFKHNNIKLIYDGTDVTYIPTSSGLTTVAFSDSERPHCIEKIGLYPDAKSYTEGYDYTFVSPSMIVWLPGGNRPDKGAAIYVTFKAKAPKEPTVEGAPLKFAYTMVPRGSQPLPVDGQVVACRWNKVQTAYSAMTVRDAAIAAHPEALYLYGGSHGNGAVSSTLQRMMPVTEAWLTINGCTGDLPGPLTGAAMAALNTSKLVLFGGSSDGTALSGDTYTFDVATKAWARFVGTGPDARKNHRMVNVDGKLYVFGGIKAAGVYCNDVWCFDGTAWTDVTPAVGDPQYAAAEAPCVEVQDNQVYLFGGRTGLTTYSNVIYRINVAGVKAVVTELTPAGAAKPTGRAFAASGIVENGIWIFGGSTMSAAPRSDVWRYDITDNVWKPFTVAGTPKARTGAASETNDGIVYIVGGANGTTTNGETWQLDPYLRDITNYEPSDIDYLPSENVIGVASVQTFDGMTNYKEDVDFIFEAPNMIMWLGANRPTPTDYDDPTTFYRVTYTALKTDTVDTDPFAPTMVADLDQVDYMLGDDFCSDGRINEVKLATQLAIRAGSNLIYYLQVRPSGDNGELIPEVDFVKALERLEPLEDAYTLVPLTDNPVVLGSVLSHVQIMSSWEERKERKMFGTWADPTATATIRSFAKNIRDFRMSIIWPGTTTMVLSDGKLHVMKGYYLAAALAGDESRGPVYRSQTNCTLSGIFTELCGPKLKRSQLDYLASAGVYICEQEAVGFPIHIRHSLTTDMSLIQTKENSLITVADYICKYMRQVLKSYIGGTNIANSPELQARIRTAAEAAMEVLKAEGTIMGGSVRKLTNPDYAPDTILLDLDIIPPYPCNYINVTIYL